MHLKTELKNHWEPLLILLLMVSVISIFGSMATMPAVNSWYAEIEKPSWNPSNAVFGPVWTVLYILIAISGWRVWNRLGRAKWQTKILRAEITPYWIQLALNFAWSPIFFGIAAPVLGGVILTALVIAVALTIGKFWTVDKIAAYLLFPYFAWTLYALSVNYGIILLN